MLMNSVSHITLNHIKVLNHVLEGKKYLKWVLKIFGILIKLFRNPVSVLVWMILRSNANIKCYPIC